MHEHERDGKHMMVLPGVGVGEACIAGMGSGDDILAFFNWEEGGVCVLYGLNSNSCIHASTSQ